MAYVTTNNNGSAIRSTLRNFGAAIIRGLEAHAEARVSPRRNLIKALEAKTDAELTEMGLKRDQITYYAFRDLYYS